MSISPQQGEILIEATSLLGNNRVGVLQPFAALWAKPIKNFVLCWKWLLATIRNEEVFWELIKVSRSRFFLFILARHLKWKDHGYKYAMRYLCCVQNSVVTTLR